MAANFFLLDNAGYYTEFSSAFEVTQWAGEDGTVTIARDQDAVENPDHPSSMKIISTTDGKGGFFDVEDLLPEITHVVEFDYKITATQDIDWQIWDQSNGAEIASGTLDQTGDWYGFYREVTTPVNCVTIRIFLRAGTATALAFYIDNIGCRGNLILEDAESKAYSRTLLSQSRLHNMQSGNAVEDATPPRMTFPLSWAYLTNTQYARLLRFVRSGTTSYFDDGNLPQFAELQNVYLETQYTYTGITNPSATHVAYSDTDVDIPNGEADFESTEFSTANYGAVDANDANSVDTSVTTTSNVKKYIYHKFILDISGEYSVIDAIQRIKVKYVGECDDLSDNDVNGVVVYVWNNNNWMRIGETTSKDKTTVDYMTDEPVQAQDFVDIAAQTVAILVRSRGHKGSSGNLTLKSYYLSVWINQDMGSGVQLSGQFTLDASGDVISVENLSDDTTLTLDTDYVIGDGLNNIKGMSETAGDLIKVTYNPRIRVTKSGAVSDRWHGTPTPSTPPRAVTLKLLALDALTEL